MRWRGFPGAGQNHSATEASTHLGSSSGLYDLLYAMASDVRRLQSPMLAVLLDVSGLEVGGCVGPAGSGSGFRVLARQRQEPQLLGTGAMSGYLCINQAAPSSAADSAANNTGRQRCCCKPLDKRPGPRGESLVSSQALVGLWAAFPGGLAGGAYAGGVLFLGGVYRCAQPVVLETPYGVLRTPCTFRWKLAQHSRALGVEHPSPPPPR